MNEPSVSPQPAGVNSTLPDTPVRLTVYPSPYQVHDGEPLDATLAELFADLPRGPKTELPYFAAHRLQPGGSRRGASLVDVGPVLLLDSDTWTSEHEERVGRLPGQWVLHPSPSGKPGRVRLWLVLSRPVTPVEYRTLYRILNGWLYGALDKQCSSPVQGYYFGTSVVDEPFAWRSYGDMPLDVDALDLDDPTPPMPAPTRAELADFDDDWRARQARDTVATFPGVGSGERHRALFRVAQTCRDWGVSLAATAEIVKTWNLAFCQPPELDEEIDSKVLIDLDRYRRHPVGCALAVTVKLHRDHGKTLDRVTRVLLHRCEQLYLRDGEIVELVAGDAMTLRPVSIDRLNELVSTHVTLLRWAKGNKQKDEPPGWVRSDAAPPWIARELYARPTHRLRELRGMAPHPCLRRDGSVLEVAGYDPKSKIYLETGEDVPHSPPKALAVEACERVMELFAQFPLTAEARSAVLAYLLTAVGRAYIDGPVPVLILDANRPQVGKSKIAEAIATVAAGYRVASRGWEGARDRMLDTLHSAVATEPRVLLFDNVDNGGLLASSVLDGALTHGKIARVKKYAHHQLELTFRPIVLITGNGVRVGSDLAPRAIHVRLVSTLEDPALRTDLKIPNLLQHVQDHLPQIASDLLTMWRAWMVVGRQWRPENAKPWSTFEGWNVVRWVCCWFGYPDPMDARRGAAARDLDTETLEMLLDWMTKRYPDGCSASSLASGLARRFADTSGGGDDEDRAELAGKLKVLCGGEIDAHALGVQLGRLADRMLGGRRLVQKRSGGKTKWTVGGEL